MSQEELAQLLNTTQSQVSRYENGENDPTSEVLAALARALDVSADWLLGLTDEIKRPVGGMADLDHIEREALRILRAKTPEKRQQAVEVLKVL
jgi:transcriptional regulator with XRE-family HTH domain